MSGASSSNRLVLLGVGQVALQVAELAHEYELIGTTRDVDKSQSLKSTGILPVVIQPILSSEQKKQLKSFISGSKILVSYPPDEKSDNLFSELCDQTATIIYISATSVYGQHQGIVNESTAVDQWSEKSKLRLKAEQTWLDKGAVILRAPGLYGPKSGLHMRIRRGSYCLPPVNSNYISRIHLKDLARIILAAFAKPLMPGSIYLVGDLKPAPQLEVVDWLCQKMNLPLPGYCSTETSTTLTSNRRVDARKILNDLNIELEFPSYKEGYADCLKLSI